MPELSVNLEGADWSDVTGKLQRRRAVVGVGLRVGAIPRGMASGRAAVRVVIDGPGGEVAVADTSLRLFVGAARALGARWGEEFMQAERPGSERERELAAVVRELMTQLALARRRLGEPVSFDVSAADHVWDEQEAEARALREAVRAVGALAVCPLCGGARGRAHAGVSAGRCAGAGARAGVSGDADGSEPVSG